jgi:serine/threonine protein kinase
MMTDRVGQQLGNYRLICLLGRGGQADVYLGEHLYLKNHAALKVHRAELSDEETAKFLAEGQTLARLKHPKIVPVHDFAVEHGTPFLVMDYTPRGTLRQQHPQGSCLSLDLVVTYTRQIAAALQYAHNRHVIHRDVKPENMLLLAHREVLLSDFGLALFTPSPERLSAQEMAGTLPYMAPEQLQGKPCFASDQYALGIVVYEWLCGTRPFEGSYFQLFHQHVSTLPPPLREKDPSLPPAVEQVVLKALSKHPEQRYVSVQLFAQALERASQAGASTLHHDVEGTGALSPISPTPGSKRIFLSSTHADNPFTTRIENDLQRRGITVRNEHDGMTANAHDQENRLRQAIRAADPVVLVISSNTRFSSLVQEHLRIAALYQRRQVFVWAEGEDLAVLLPEAGEKNAPTQVFDARNAHYKLALDELVSCLEEKTGTLASDNSTLVEPPSEPRNPYKGLRAFTESDATDFFGREHLVEELVEAVKERLRSEQSDTAPVQLLPVIGPSGSGKSSVVMAGLMPRLRQDALAGSGEWVYLTPMLPGTHPLEVLALTFAPHLPERSVKSIREDLEDHSARGLHLLATQLVKASEKKVVLFIDQFEEVFNLTASPDERGHFFELLRTAITERKGPVLLILTFRADFYDRLMVSGVLGRLIAQHQLLMWPMEVDELRAAIKGPAALPDVLLTFEGNLVSDLLYEVRGEPGALPLLQFTLDQLFERRKDHLLTQQAYEEIGGVKGALSKHAEATYLALPSAAHRETVRTLFLRLIGPGMTEQETTRRRTQLRDLVFIDPEQTRLMQETIDLFVKARLLTANTNTESETTIEVSHEALIREWSRLVNWLHAERSDIRLQYTISEDAAAWEQNKHPVDRLYRGAQFKEARAWAKRNTASRQEHTFLQASAARRLRAFITLVVVVLLIITSSGIAGWLALTRPPQPPKAGYVTTTDEYAIGSLLWAIGSALPGDTITFARELEGKTITLRNVDLHIFQQNLRIQGPATGHITIQEIGAGLIVDTPASATISGLVFQGSNAKDQPSLIENKGKLTLAHCIVSGNAASTLGGGIHNSGTMTMTDSIVSGNTSFSPFGPVSAGGGISNDEYGTMTMTNSIVSGNATSSAGGGLANYGTLTTTNSTISGNTTSGTSGGIFNSGTITMTNSTISGNTSYEGGGILNDYSFSKITIIFCTIANNDASSGYGLNIAIYPGSQAYIKASIIGGNDPQHNPIAGVITSGGYNVIQNISPENFDASPAHTTDRSVDDLTELLGSHPQLQNNGGPTQTYQLTGAAGNPAIDNVPLDACTNDQGNRVSTDERGMPRPGKNKQRCDSGAFEDQR